MFDLKKLITVVMQNDTVLIEAMKQIIENKPKFADLFRGKFKDKLEVLCKGFATFAVVFLEKYEKIYNISEEQLIDTLASKMVVYIPAIPIPIVGGYISTYFGTMVCHFLITYAMQYVKKESQITIIYEKSFAYSEKMFAFV